MEKVTIQNHHVLEYDFPGVFQTLNKLWNIDKNEFPGPQPISIERKHITNLKNKTYMVGIKNDGQRYALCFFIHENKNISCLINRKGEVYLLNIKATAQAFQGTIVDCELVNDKLFVFDCIIMCGRVISEQSFSDRLNHCDTLLSCIKSIKHNITIEQKKFVNVTEFSDLLNTNEISDGYIFIPLNKPITIGTHNSMYKWKPKFKNTIDFALMGTKVYLQNGGKLTWVKISLDMTNVAIEISKTEHVVVESEYVAEKKWKGLFIRRDKTMPNSQFTYKKTLINIQENIQEHEFIFN
jgi:hypothetical protein